MKQRSFHIGPGAPSIMLIVVLLSMSVLGMLTLMNARSDAQLSARSVDVAESVYRLNEQAEAHARELDKLLYAYTIAAADETAYTEAINAVLPDGMTADGDMIYWTENDSEGRSLECAVELAPYRSTPRFTWVSRTLVTEFADDTEQSWSLWGA